MSGTITPEQRTILRSVMAGRTVLRAARFRYTICLSHYLIEQTRCYTNSDYRTIVTHRIASYKYRIASNRIASHRIDIASHRIEQTSKLLQEFELPSDRSVVYDRTVFRIPVATCLFASQFCIGSPLRCHCPAGAVRCGVSFNHADVA